MEHIIIKKLKKDPKIEKQNEFNKKIDKLNNHLESIIKVGLVLTSINVIYTFFV